VVNNERSLNQQFTNLRSLEKNDNNEFDTLQNINLIIGKYLLSLFYYKDIIKDERNFKNSSDFVIKYLKSARKDEPAAQYNLGCCYENEYGTYRDYNKAFEWYSKSADNGFALGQTNLGNLYYYGKGKKIDYDKAFKWYSKSANNGCSKGQNNLGNCYEKGL